MKNDSVDVDNVKLILDNINHINMELESEDPFYFRVAREAHQLLLRSMVEALRGSANEGISGRSKSKKMVSYYKIGDDPWKKIQKENIEGCEKAWRYSDPKESEAPVIKSKDDKNEFLKEFYELLAMIQTECWMSNFIHRHPVEVMGRFIHSHPVEVNDEEMAILEWLHEKVRNEYEHFMPKIYIPSTEYMLLAAKLCVRLSLKLLYVCGSVIPDDIIDIKKTEMEHVLQRIQAISAN